MVAALSVPVSGVARKVRVARRRVPGGVSRELPGCLARSVLATVTGGP